MTDRPSWMPSDEEINQACNEDDHPDYQPSAVAFVTNCELIRALIRTAAEKALAEQEVRHKREVIEARIDQLQRGIHVLVSGGTTSGKHHQDPATANWCVPCRAILTLRAALAALDKEVKP